MLEQKDIINIHISKKKLFFKEVRSRLSIKMFDDVQAEEILYLTFDRIMNSPQALKGFNDEHHVINYTMAAIKDRARMAYFVKKHSDGKIPLSNEEMGKNYIIAMNIINSHRVKNE